MLQYNPHLEENYIVSSIISRLKEEIKHRVKTNKPSSLATAGTSARQAKLHEMSVQIDYQIQPNPHPNLSSKDLSQPQKSNQVSSQNGKAFLDHRRANDLSFRYREKFTPGHQCKVKYFNSMEEEIIEEKEVATEEKEMMEHWRYLLMP